MQAGGNVAVTSLPLATNAATATNQLDILARLDPVWSALQSGFVGSKIAKLITYFGQRTAFPNTTQYHDVFSYLSSAAAYGGDMTGTEALEIVSSSINDTSAGTCARTVVYCYIDALNGDIETIATATLNGTTAVALGAGVRAKTSNGWKFAPPDPRRTTRERSRYARPERVPRGNKSRAATALDERAIYGPRRIYRVRVQSALFCTGAANAIRDHGK